MRTDRPGAPGRVLRRRGQSDHGRWSGGPWRWVAAVTISGVVLVALCAAIGWRVSGGTWAIVSTPSMGRSVPVGTLILTRADPISSIEVGDVVTYVPPQAAQSWFTHRVVARFPDGTLQVQGDVNGSPDPFAVTADNLVGKVVHQVYGVGWLIRALPYLLVGMILTFVITGTYVSSRYRSAARVLATCLLFATSALILRPFVHPFLVAVSTDDQTPHATVISAGLMPTRISGAPGHFVDLTNGEEGVVPVAGVEGGGPFVINGSPHLDLPWAALVGGICALPLLWCLIVGLSPDEDEA